MLALSTTCALCHLMIAVTWEVSDISTGALWSPRMEAAVSQ
jgi:coenzyme F420-reducing hydrogenase beta subunit